MFSNINAALSIPDSVYTPKFSVQDLLYPEITPFEEGKLKVSERHTLWYAQYGHPKGTPVVVLHGGPGGGCGPNDMRYFDPAFYRIILLDQRGSKRSTPQGEIKENTTQHLIQDLEQLKHHLKIDQWLILGGSWGSTYALLYAEQYPDACLGFILRGVFLGTASENKAFWYGMQDIFPEAWEALVAHLSHAEQQDLIQSYDKRLNHPDSAVHLAAANAFMKYDLICSFLNIDHTFLEKTLADKHAMLAVARILTHYCKNNFFIKENEILDNLHKIKHLPLIIVQGRYDIVCRPKRAYQLHKAWPGSQLVLVPESGHAALEIGTTKALVAASNRFKDKL